ncbi:MAG: hypothetical protein WB791_08205 [Waddliaceae bacterium]
MSIHERFQWECQPKAEALVMHILEEACHANPQIAKLQEELHRYTSTRLFDWLDHVIVGISPTMENDLEEAGFVSEDASPSYRVFCHPGAQLPRIVLKDHDKPVAGIAVKVENIADFLLVRGLSGWIEGTPFSGYRRCSVPTDEDVSLWVVERRGTLAMEPTYMEDGFVDKYVEGVEKWKSRPRGQEEEEEAIHTTLAIAEELISLLGKNLAAWVVLEVERSYWQARNPSGQIQKNRQDRLGMGWANHDHHTFRSSRKFFCQLVRLFEMLGFRCRERFYAGEEAGWGAQVMENDRAGLVLFLDLDLSSNELAIDFAHHPLPELKQLGTIGLWCGLHGESILKAGMHHLEAQFMFEDLTEDLSHHGIQMMEPFSFFPYLKQAFTHGEIWPADPKRVKKLEEAGKISPEEADKFLKYGAIGSHLENLQRREGYKGFNQSNVSIIIQKTDPRIQKTDSPFGHS